MPTTIFSKIKSSLSNQTDSQIIILGAAISSRLLILSLIIIWKSLIYPYDTSAALNPTCLTSQTPQQQQKNIILFPSIGSAIESTIVWDGVYFVRIAECGYEYEQTYAFLPLLPICIYAFSNSVFAPLVRIIGYRPVLGLSGYLINNIAFVFAAVYFYRLSLIVLKDEKAALRASLLFCFNPASVFYSSVYSESLYALFSLGGIYHLMSGANTIAVLQLALSGSARSNGVLNAGYFCFQTMHWAYDAIFQKHHVGLAVQSLAAGALRSLFIFVPFIVFQAYGYYNICLGRLPDEMSPWCKARLPVLYDYLQSHYWGVGFLRYFQLKQLPNFLLASPILSLALFAIVHYAKLHPGIFLSLGFGASCEAKKCAAVLYSLQTTKELNGAQLSQDFSSNVLQGDPKLRRRQKKSKEEDSVPFPEPVATRFLAASPPLYWFSAYLMTSAGASSRWGYVIWVYSISYILLGSLLFSNFYPFT
ncbi:hypothetical protein IFM89_035108 [Coptis chinensis]|uniref:GPI mannosyltransferase 2 n=1 Tax=Coptis chinensis TaxID=261450 RepID=A0A835IGD8_9MAGN|nr:hypothetical protein IFM89_035108 [Coptis chinensis]